MNVELNVFLYFCIVLVEKKVDALQSLINNQV